MGVAHYYAMVRIERDYPDRIAPESKNIEFEVPCDDMGNADFEANMPAKHLLRWVNNE